MSDDIEQNRFHLMVTRFSQNEFERVWEKRQALKAQSEDTENTEKYEFVKDLQQDLFTALHRSIHDENGRMRKDHVLQKPVVKAIMESEEYGHLHKVTRLEEWEAAEATRHLTPKALDMIKDLQDKMDEMAEGGDGDGNEPAEQGPGKGAGKDKRGEMKKIALAMKELDLETIIKDALVEVRRAVRDSSEALEGLNFSQVPITPDRKEELNNLLNNNTQAKEVLSRAPNFKQLAMSTQKSKIKKGHSEISEIEKGNAIERVLPSQFRNLISFKKGGKV
jgi:hypothetical protein